MADVPRIKYDASKYKKNLKISEALDGKMKKAEPKKDK